LYGSHKRWKIYRYTSSLPDLIRDLIDRGSIQGLDPSCAAAVYGPTQFMKP
jgi:hypothetical protein